MADPKIPSGSPEGNLGRNNPLGQRDPSSSVGGGIDRLKHDQSSDIVEEVRENAGKEKPRTGKKPEEGQYDIAGPDRQPTKVVRQEDLGKQKRQLQDGSYTQDNEEEPPTV